MSALPGSNPRAAKCESCGMTVAVHWVPRPGQIPGAAGAHRLICGSCEYAEDHENAQRIARTPRVRAPQDEALF